MAITPEDQIHRVTLAHTIRCLTRDLIADHGGLVIGQCLSAVGWVGGTVPDEEDVRHGIAELPMSDIAGAGFAVGAAITGRPVVLVIRFQSFLWLNASPLVNYAAKCRSIWGGDCPLWVRAIASDNAGPIHTGYHDQIFMGVDGLKVIRPKTPAEYVAAWNDWLVHKNPVICSEHRGDYRNANVIAEAA